MSEYRSRVVDGQLDALMPELPAILLDGPKGVGKTATALRRAATVRRLDKEDQRKIAEASADAVLTGPAPVLLDEWQRVPAVWDAVKRSVDADRSGGRFLLTGSAPESQLKVHSGAGRITSIRMRPMTLPERGTTTPTVSLAQLLRHSDAQIAGMTQWQLGDYTEAILGSGFPGLAGLSTRAVVAQLDGYIDRIVQRDVKEAGFVVRRPATLKAWLAAYAAATCTTTNWEKIRRAATTRRSAQPARSTVEPYRDVLTELRLLDEIPATSISSNHLRELALMPKHNLADPGLAARLVGVGLDELLSGEPHDWVPRDGTFLGALFESLTALTLRVFAESVPASVSHLRTRDGRNEVDFIVQAAPGRIVAVEVKLTSAIDQGDLRHLLWLRERLGADVVNSVVITTGPQAYRRDDGIAVVPLALLGP